MRSLPVGLVLGAVALLRLSTPASAQLGESLTVTLMPGAVNFALTRGSSTNAGNVAIAATTAWSLLLLRTTITLDGYFSSASGALVHASPGNTVDIPSSRVEVSVNGGAHAPFNQSVSFGAPNAGRQLMTQSIGILNLVGHRTDVLTLNINLAGYSLPADTYSGTLRIRARATP